MFTQQPLIRMAFNEPEIPFKEIADNEDYTVIDHTIASSLWHLVRPGDNFATVHEKGHFFNEHKAHPDKPINTVCATSGHGSWHPTIQRLLNDRELLLASSFPLDYNPCRNPVRYIVGMSVPPIMIAHIASNIYEQWLKHGNPG